MWNLKLVQVKPQKNESSWQLVEVTKFHLHFWLINVYGPTSTFDNKNLWDEISKQIGAIHNEKIIIAEYFNAITSLEEKSSGIVPPPKVMADFSHFILTNALRDIQPKFGKFTWTNKRKGFLQITERLDRFLVSPNWFISPHKLK